MSRISIIKDVVAGYFSITRNDLVSDRRAEKVARPRMTAMWICRHETPLSLPFIGRAFNRDHTTVMHACERIEELRAADPLFREATDNLRARARSKLLSAGDITPDQKSMIERELTRQRAALVRMAIANPAKFERQYGELEPSPEQVERQAEGAGAHQ
jgi:hypothetical protein